jgi:putative ABC transport system permease protein
MYFTYLFRELSKRKKQTSLISIGLALGIALVVLVSAVSGGIKTAQAQALSGLYGIGTDISVTKSAEPGSNFQRFNVGGSNSSKSARVFSRSRLEIERNAGTLSAEEVAAISKAKGVKASVATLKLNNVSFSGTLPTFNPNQVRPAPGQMPSGNNRPTGGSDGKGGSSFSITTVSVEGVGLGTSKLGPLAAVKVTSGRALSEADAGKYVAELDSNYATTAKLKVGSSVTLGASKFAVVGILKSTSTTATTPSNVYIPLNVAQTLSGEPGVYTNVYVSAESAANLPEVKSSIQKAAPKATVATSAELASKVSGSISSAAELVNVMGSWLSIIVLLAAFGMAILFTTSGVNRRIREFGTLKAIGWRSGRVVSQVVGESIFTGLLGGLIGIALGFAGVWAVNTFAPSLTASVATTQFGPGGLAGGFGGPGSQQATNALSLALHANLDFTIILTAIGLAILGGLLAGFFGGLRAARLSPATALRSLE